MTATLDDDITELRRANAELQQRLEERTAELQARTADRDEAQAQQVANAEVLQVINSSPGDLEPVFGILLDKAMRLCDAAFGVMFVTEGEQFRAIAAQGVPAAYAQFRRHNPVRRPGQPGIAARVRAGEPFLHMVDLKDDDLYRNGDPQRRAMVDLGGARTSLHVALKKDRDVLGEIEIYRQEVRPFSNRDIALLENSAAQAVIAIDNARLLDEIRQRQAELRVTFDNMADGVAMFDENLRLAAWNRNFQQIADLPEDLLAERPSYADYLRILTERGELDILRSDEALSRRVEHTDQELRLERTRPNGQVIEVRRNAVPDGGFVLIYSDITERKRSEAEISAARDAAEIAYRDLKAAQANLVQAEKMASRRAGLTLVFVQLALNVAWSWMFFGAHNPALGLINIILQLAVIVATILVFLRFDRVAAWCVMPLAVCVAFATILNFAIWSLNA